MCCVRSLGDRWFSVYVILEDVCVIWCQLHYDRQLLLLCVFLREVFALIIVASLINFSPYGGIGLERCCLDFPSLFGQDSAGLGIFLVPFRGHFGLSVDYGVLCAVNTRKSLVVASVHRCADAFSVHIYLLATNFSLTLGLLAPDHSLWQVHVDLAPCFSEP